MDCIKYLILMGFIKFFISKGCIEWYTDFSLHSQFAPFLVGRFAPNSYLGKTFRPLPIHGKDVSPPSS